MKQDTSPTHRRAHTHSQIWDTHADARLEPGTLLHGPTKEIGLQCQTFSLSSAKSWSQPRDQRTVAALEKEEISQYKTLPVQNAFTVLTWEENSAIAAKGKRKGRNKSTRERRKTAVVEAPDYFEATGTVFPSFSSTCKCTPTNVRAHLKKQKAKVKWTTAATSLCKKRATNG